MRIVLSFITCAVMLIATSTYSQARYVLGQDVADEVQANIYRGVSAGETFFKQKLGVSIAAEVRVIASGNEQFLQANVPGRYYFPNCNGGYGNLRTLVLCTGSEAFNRSRFAGGRGLQQEVITLHEYVHVVQSELARGKPLGPAWLTEGFAEHVVLLHKVDRRVVTFSKEINHQRSLARRQGDRLSSLEARQSFNTSPTSVSAGMVAVAELQRRAGLIAFRTYWDLIGRGQPWEQAFTKAFGLSPHQFYAECKL